MFNLKGKNLIILILAVLCLVLAGGLAYFNLNSLFGKKVVSLEEGQKLILDYVNKKVLQGMIEAKVGGIGEENGLYKFQLEIGKEKLNSYLTKDGKLFFPQAIDLEEAGKEIKTETKSTTLGNFSVSEDEVCQEDGKPVIYFFGSKRCPHCTWEHPIIEEVVKSFESYVSFHNNMDSSDDRDVFSKYSTGGVPTIVLGCRYFRVGSGERVGEEQEAKHLTALICKLTNNQPAEVCEQVKDLLQQTE